MPLYIDKPVFDKMNEEEVTGIEDEPLIISLKADGNPSSITYTWTKDGLPVGQSTTGMERVIAEGSVLNITKLSRNDAGAYTCEAINSQGSSVIHVNVSVECKLLHDAYAPFTNDKLIFQLPQRLLG